jgi:hypothetical protein
MGVRAWLQRGKFNDPVPGTFEVHSCDNGTWGGAHVDLTANGVLSVPGLGLVPAEFRGKVPPAKRPIVGQVLPVIVDRADPTQFRIEWDQVPSVTERVEREADITVTGADLSALPPEAQQQIHSLLGNLGQVLQQGFVSAPHAHTPAPDWDVATATVLACHNARVPAFAMSQAPGGIVDLTLDVRLADGYEYSTKTRVAFSTPERRAKATEKGTELPVRVDPADPNRVVIDIDRIPHW